ncbi:hypothetical protein HBB16_16215 [Pseudonocardia sp. MCCB 268]|nr:hypothetical protein [Pseudonocardia cytotoxica]
MDRPYGTEDTAVTPAGERAGESPRRAADQEVPDDVPPEASDRSGACGDDSETQAADVGVDGAWLVREEAAVHDADEPRDTVDDESPAEDPGGQRAVGRGSPRGLTRRPPTPSG